MRIIFMGTPEFALPSLNRLLDAGHDVAAVVTVPDKPAGRGRHLRPSAVKECTLRLNLPLLQPEELRAPDFIKDLRRLAADLFVVVAFRILPPEVFTLPGIGTINLHASLLPKYRGAAPINWAIINGEQETGATTFFIDEKVDTGQWLMQCRVPIGEEMSAGELHDLLAEEGGELLLRTVAGLEAGSLKPRPQEGEITRAPKLTREMALIDWRRPAREIHNLVRGLSPYPSAWSLWRGKTLKILKVRPGPAEAQEQPGTLINAGGRGPLLAATGEGTLELVTLQPEGGKALTAADFLRGHSLKPGEIIG